MVWSISVKSHSRTGAVASGSPGLQGLAVGDLGKTQQSLVPASRPQLYQLPALPIFLTTLSPAWPKKTGLVSLTVTDTWKPLQAEQG